MQDSLLRRTFLKTAGSGLLIASAPAFLRGQNAPLAEQGAMAGDVIPGRAMIWSRANKPARMSVLWSTSEKGQKNRVFGPDCLDVTDYTGRVELTGLPSGQTIYYEVHFEDLVTPGVRGVPVTGTFQTPQEKGEKDVTVLWSGDTVGQGWGINRAFGGMKIYEAMRALHPDVFIHSGDTVYADNPVKATVTLAGGGEWHNVVTEEKSKVAETLAEFRGQHRYNFIDDNLRRFHSEVAQVWQWDDHEVCNNWSDSKILGDAYRDKSIRLLAARAKRAFLEYAPLRYSSAETERVYRHIPYGPHVDIFVVDMRTYRGPNSYNLQPEENDASAFMGKPQIAWLQQGLRNSRATWKIIAADMPIGLNVDDGQDAQGRKQYEAIANGDNGPARGREIEFSRLLKFIKDQNIQNTVWVTADVHYTAAHHYHPDRAQFKEFLPFWEFVSGPLNAGAFGPSKTDGTFGIEVAFQKHPPAGQGGVGPASGMMFFGEMKVAAGGRTMTVNLRDMAGQVLYTKVLAAA